MLNVYIIKEGSTILIDNSLNILDINERGRYKSFKYRSDKIRFLERHIVLRKILEKHINIKADKIKFTYNKFGKPSIKDNNIFFSISKTEGFFIIVVSNKEVGIDVEKIKKIKDLGAASIFCAKDEMDYIKTNPNMFLKIWTLKESLIKCIGEGMSFNLKRSCLNFNNQKIILKIDNKVNSRYRFISFKKMNMIVSICYTDRSNNYKIINVIKYK